MHVVGGADGRLPRRVGPAAAGQLLQQARHAGAEPVVGAEVEVEPDADEQPEPAVGLVAGLEEEGDDCLLQAVTVLRLCRRQRKTGWQR